MAYIGCKHPVCAPIASEPAQAEPTYSGGMVMGEAIGVTLTFEHADAKQHGDDVIVESANDITGYTISFNATRISDAAREAILGETATGGSGPYKINAGGAPYVGFGFIRVVQEHGVKSFEGWWCYKAQFALNEEAANTKTDTIDFGSPTLEGTGLGVYNDTTGVANFVEHQTFATEALALAYINGKAGIQ